VTAKSALFIPFVWKVPKKHLKVFTFPVLLKNTTMFVCKLPIRLLLQVGRVHYVIHAWLTSDFLCLRLLKSQFFWWFQKRCLYTFEVWFFFDVVDNIFALLHICQSCSGSGFSESRIRIFGEFFGPGAGLDIIFAQAGSGAGLSKTLRLENFLFFHDLIFSCKNYLITW